MKPSSIQRGQFFPPKNTKEVLLLLSGQRSSCSSARANLSCLTSAQLAASPQSRRSSPEASGGMTMRDSGGRTPRFRKASLAGDIKNHKPSPGRETSAATFRAWNSAGEQTAPPRLQLAHRSAGPESGRRKYLFIRSPQTTPSPTPRFSH